MKSDFLLAITQLAAEKNLPREIVLNAVESALVSAYRKNSFTPTQEISVKIDPSSGKVEVWAEKTVVEKVLDPRAEIALVDAYKFNAKAKIDDVISVEDTPRNAGRIAAQTAKQVILQRLHEAEHSAIFEEYTDKEGEIITGVVRRIETRQLFIDLGRAEAVMPVAEQAPNERYHIGQRLKVYLLEIGQSVKGPLLIVSRSHPNLLRRLFELEVPEIYNGTVEIKAVAREAGFRSKVAVVARQEGIDPVGCCVGLRGIRIQNIVNELNGEKIDVVNWNSDITNFMANALSPAKITSVTVNEDEKTASVVIPDKQLSLAIGKEGQNVRLAVKLTGWRIDIKSASEVEEERLKEIEERHDDVISAAEELSLEGLQTSVETPTPVDNSDKKGDAIEAIGNELKIPSTLNKDELKTVKKELRFAEEIIPTSIPKPESKAKKKKKSSKRKETAEDGIRLKKQRRSYDDYGDEEDEY
ncbi:MAG: transcription termination/antitermination protein NusA [Dehalococcoidia bacterium]|nr:MAG: transcription termination/antitermination protein NusA [Dehalococcoidia bacterium]